MKTYQPSESLRRWSTAGETAHSPRDGRAIGRSSGGKLSTAPAGGGVGRGGLQIDPRQRGRIVFFLPVAASATPRTPPEPIPCGGVETSPSAAKSAPARAFFAPAG